MKTCAQCGGRLGLGVRFANYWHWIGFVHKRFCSHYCENLYETEQENTKQLRRFRAWLDGGSIT